MSCFIYNTDEESNRKINIDELFDKKQRRDLKQLEIYNKILNRVHRRITLISRNKSSDTHIWFTVPEYIFGEQLYDNADCTGYIVAKLEENGFHVKYMHPNTLFISWNNWVPSYVRTQIKKKTGIVIDEKGNIVEKLEEGKEGDVNSKLINGKPSVSDKNAKQYTPVDQYKPTGNLVYNQDVFEKLEKKVSFI
jgi:hypothetical protein